MEFIVRPIAKEERPRFFQLADELGSVFASSTWIDKQDSAILLGVFRKDGQLQGGCALKESRLKFFKVLTNTTYAANSGFFFRQDASQNAQRIASLKAALQSLVECIDEMKYPLVDISFPPEIQDVQVFQWKGFRSIPSYTYRLDLKRSEEEIWGSVHSSRKNRIRKLESEGLVLNTSPEGSELAKTICDKLDSKTFHFDRKLLSSIVASSLNERKGIGVLALKNNEPVSASFAYLDKSFSYYLFGGTSTGNSDQGSSLALYRLILESKKRGSEVFDFEGSMIPEIERFFRSFGGALTPYYKIRKASLWMEGLLRVFKKGYWN